MMSYRSSLAFGPTE